ncbi:MAG: hypothetical protein WBO43_02720 [Gemmatimonadota bacterium]
MKHHLRTGMLIAAIAPLLGACDGNSDGLSGPSAAGPGSVSLSVSVPQATGPSAAVTSGGALFDIVQNDGASELVITRVAMVLREIELERQFDDDCDDHVSGSDDDCEEFSTGPMILELPVDGGVDHVLSINNVPADVYDEVEFEIHKPEDDTAADMDFIRANPDFERVSIRVEGTWNGEAFTYLTDLNEEQEYDLSPPLQVDGTTPVNVTLSIDVTTWFVAPDGSLVDPRTANDGGANENLVENNIERSIDVFEDDDRDGDDDNDDSFDDSSDDSSNDSSDDS